MAPFLRGILRPYKILLLAVCALLAGLLLANGWASTEFRKGKKAYQAEDYDEAQRHFRSCRHIWGRRGVLHLWQARAARWQGDLQEAETQLKECRRLGYNTEEVQLEWLLLRFVRGEIDQLWAGLWFTVSDDYPHSVEILKTMTAVYLNDIRYRDASACLERWLQMDPQAIRALEWRAWLKERLGRSEAALDDYRAALALAPERNMTRARVAHLLLDSAAATEALKEYEYLHASEPDNLDYYVGIGRAKFLLGQADEARRIYHEVLTRDPDHDSALRALAKLEVATGEYRNAEQLSRKLLAKDPVDFQANYTLYLSLQGQSGREAEAKEQETHFKHFRDALDRVHTIALEIDQYLNNADKMAEFGADLIEVGQADRGLVWLDRALKLNPHHRFALETLVKYYQNRDPAKAEVFKNMLSAES
ncbi:MAG TPA: tetratricopeptide repeat protein [Gemmataceae bacterium]|nr:tetratricopeptide repeat protein [Gemmataceae bacterium]